MDHKWVDWAQWWSFIRALQGGSASNKATLLSFKLNITFLMLYICGRDGEMRMVHIKQYSDLDVVLDLFSGWVSVSVS